MTTKADIIEQIGEPELLLPELVSRGLAANDRLKYYLTLLQTALAHADNPRAAVSNLRSEREACGVDDRAFDEVVANSHRIGADRVLIPGTQALNRLIIDDLQQMLEPLHAGAGDDDERRDRHAAFARRLELLVPEIPAFGDVPVIPSAIHALTRAADGRGDTVHQLVMDLHRELNHLHAGVALESIEGARAFALTAGDRLLVQAFMKGVNETAPLKFDHPGLGTTATRIADRLSIQNDLGTTDAHVVVINVVDRTATVIYTDIHPRRVAFFQDMLEPFALEWEEPPGDQSAAFQMRVGRFTAETGAALELFLTFVGSRLVFLIDWNRARKRLSRFVKKSDAVALLKSAAANNVGHRAFLQAGDVQLIYTALERGAPAQMRYGARLDELLGRENAKAFLSTVLATVSTGLRTGRSPHLIQDEIEAELLTYLQTTDRSMLGAAAEHAMLITALGDRLRRSLMRLRAGIPEELERTAELAKAWETRADDVVRRTVRAAPPADERPELRRLIIEADDAADALEETGFLLTLLRPATDAKGLALIDNLAEVVAHAAREYVRCLEGVRALSRVRTRRDVGELLVSVDRLTALEQEADTLERAVVTSLVNAESDHREWHVLFEIARALEEAADCLARCGLILRDYALASAAGGP